MKLYLSIKDLLRKVYDASEKVFKGTLFEDEWLFYHDTLSLMTATSTIRWMKEVNIYKRWLLSKNNLNGGTTYSGRPVGNSPEFMPLDNALNDDIQQSLSLYCAITLKLDNNDKRKFSMRTPNETSKGIRRIFQEGKVPSSNRILQDINNDVITFRTVFQHQGRMVPGLANRSGHRNHAASKTKSGQGGLRVTN